MSAAPPPVAAGTDRAFAHTVETDAPPERVWALWTDVAGWPAWDPEVRAALTHGVSFHGVGGRLLARVLGPRFRRALPGVMGRLVRLAESP